VRLHIAFVSIGSNLGDPLENCRRAVDRLAALAQVRVTGRSRLYRTAPVGYTEQGWFVNQVVRVETELGPEALLARLQEIECELGKTPPAVRFGPRVIDLDILLFDRQVLEGPQLVIPHPRMHTRRFVLRPLCDIEPSIVHPVLGRDARSLLAALGETGQEEVVELPCCG
jgi:2-amino-4-hydroxy-6-hydroxymethyldihydropteridine diphosphokinase